MCEPEDRQFTAFRFWKPEDPTGVPLRSDACLVGGLDDRDSLRRGGPLGQWSLALLVFREAVVMLRRGDIQSMGDLLRDSAVEEDRIGKFCMDGMTVLVLAAMKLLRPFFTPTSLALYGTNVPPDGKMGEVSSVSADLGPFLPSSRIELFVVSRLMEDSRTTESFLA